MTADYKALCAQLADDLQEARDAVSDWAAYASEHFKQKHDLQGELGRIQRQIDRARAALAQPEPVGPTDEEIADWHDECADLTQLGAADHHWAFDLRRDEVAGVVHAALARWGRPAITPIPVSERRLITMPIPLTPLQPLLLLQQDDCAPDALESFLANFPLHSGGLSLEEFKDKARCEDFDDGFATYWHLGPLILSISADDPFYSLHRASPLIAP